MLYQAGEYIEFLDEVTENKELKDLVGKLIKYIECIKGLKGTYEILKAGNFDKYFIFFLLHDAIILADTFICNTQEFSPGRHGRIQQRL